MTSLEGSIPSAKRWPATGTIAIKGIGLGQSLAIALRTLAANRLRTLLTALGVMIGVAVVIALLAIGRGAQKRIADSITANGANLLTVRAGSLRAGGFTANGGSGGLTIEDARALAEPSQAPAISLVSPEDMTFGRLIAGKENTSAMIIGAEPAYLPIHNNKLRSGEFINEQHLRSASNVMVLGSRLAETLFPGQDPVGQRVRLNGQSFRVIGVLETKGAQSFGMVDDSAIVPLTTVQRRLSRSLDRATGKPTVQSIVVQARDENSLVAASSQIASILRERHELPMNGAADDFSIDNQQDLIDTLTESQRTMTFYLGSTAAISLLVGGIGIMNIMLVSVRERTREIGLRKAMGAREGDILTQFLIEALTLSTGGGIIGILIGVLIAVVVGHTGQTPTSISPLSVVLALGFAVATGLFFGIEPARRAARLDPIVALRYE